MNEATLALEAIQNKLSGKKLTYKEILAVMDQIAQKKLGDILTTYFAASGYTTGFTNEEIFFLTKAMIETGEQLHFKGIVADKHSIGGVPGTRTTLIVIPIVAAAGFTIPKTSSRAITTPGGTADDMEILAPVTFNTKQIYKIVEKANACIVWGGGVDIAPADDELIKVEEPLFLESFDKILVSIMAKKIAAGSNHVVIDLPYGKHVKVHTVSDAELVAKKFRYLAEKFDIKLAVQIHKVEQPAGRGIGPLLETKDALMVLEQHANRPIDLEKRVITLATELLNLCLKDAKPSLKKEVAEKFGNAHAWASFLLTSGKALTKMKEIIKAQGGNSAIISEDLLPGKHMYHVLATKSGTVKKINSRNTSVLAKILGAPSAKKSGIYLEKKIGETVKRGETLYTLYSETAYHLKEARDSLKHFPIIEYS